MRGTLSASEAGNAHGHFAIASKDSSQRYRALTGSIDAHGIHSIELERVQTGAGMIELASLEIKLLGSCRDSGSAKDAEIVLRRIPDGREFFRAAVLLDEELMQECEVMETESPQSQAPAGVMKASDRRR